jgi:hypothetical protein
MKYEACRVEKCVSDGILGLLAGVHPRSGEGRRRREETTEGCTPDKEDGRVDL